MKTREYGNLALLTVITMLALLGLNVATQPYEDAISLIPPVRLFYLDLVWYLDDVIGPALFVAGSLYFLFSQVYVHRNPRALWPLMILALSFLAFGLGDTVDAHWVYAQSVKASDELKSFSSYGSKVMAAAVLTFGVIYSLEWLNESARKALLFVLFLMLVDLLILSMKFDFGGYPFHVFEECLEVVAGLLFAFRVAPQPLAYPRGRSTR